MHEGDGERLGARALEENDSKQIAYCQEVFEASVELIGPRDTRFEHRIQDKFLGFRGGLIRRQSIFIGKFLLVPLG
ncbi:hypothetical protein [Caballeronia fortuita]|uniref:hypothetical protein n=1 Tax=Caballeronia fortuita TaxID=1777138 RepID=UPI0012FE496E|nr:hypothetical protein [Caballeronia fortuita]